MPLIAGILAGIVTTILVAAAEAAPAVLKVGRDLVSTGATRRRRYRKTARRKEGEVLPTERFHLAA